jgi:hypothetical protein
VTTRRTIRAASSAGVRARTQHSLAPAHLGDATAAATLAVIVGGIALVITGIGMVALALTIGARFGGDPPPNVESLTLGPALLGVVTLAFGAALAAGGLGVLAQAHRARAVTGILSAIAAAIAAIITVVVATATPPDIVIAGASTVAALVFGVAALLLLRPRR